MSISKGSKLRRSRTVDPSHKGCWIYTYIVVSDFRGWKSRKHCNGNREVTKRDIPKVKGIVWATAEPVSEQVARHFRVSWNEVPNSLH
jgi:hypothetical protein